MKKLISILFLLVFHVAVKSQSCDKLQELSLYYFQNNKYEESLKYSLEGLGVCKKTYGENSKEYALSCFSAAQIYSTIKDHPSSLNYYFKSEEITKSLGKEFYYMHASILLSIGDTYYSLQSFQNAEKYYIKYINYIKNEMSEVVADYFTGFIALGNLYYTLADYKKSVINYQEALRLIKKYHNDNSLQKAILYNNLGLVYFKEGKYEQSEIMYNQSINLFKESNQKDNINYTSSIENLALLYSETGNYSTSEKLYLEVLEIIKTKQGINNVDYALTLNNLGMLYDNMQLFSKSESMLLEALSIQRRVLNKNHSDIAATLNNLSSIYYKLKIFNNAELYVIESLSIQKKIYGSEHPDYITSLNNLGMIYSSSRNFLKADSVLSEVVSLRKNVLGSTHLHYAISLNNLAIVKFENKKLLEAEKLNREALFVIQKLYGKKSLQYINSLSVLATMSAQAGNILIAKNAYDEISQIFNELNIKDGFDIILTYNNKAHFNEMTSKLLDANLNFIYAITSLQKTLQNSISFLSSSQAEIHLQSNKYFYDASLSFLVRKPYMTVNSDLFNFNLFFKNAILKSNNLLNISASISKDSSVMELWNEYKALRKQISNQLQLPKEEQINLSVLNEKSEVIEKELMRKLPGFKASLENSKLTWRDLHKKLNRKDAIIDFVHFRYFNNGWTDSLLYAAFLMRPEWDEPKFVSLFSEDQITHLFDSTNQQKHINTLYQTKDSSSVGNLSLYNLLWRPLDSLLHGVTRVYLSPSGLLHRVSFGAIPTPEGSTINDIVEIHTVSHLGSIMESNTGYTSPTSTDIYGAINYDIEPSLIKIKSLSVESSTDLLRSLKGGKWNFLSGTSEEVNSLQRIFTNNSIKTSIYTNNNASEEQFKLIGTTANPAPSVLHLATHGFTFPTPIEKPNELQGMMMQEQEKRYVLRQSDDPLTRAGLIMSGGNKAWSTGQSYTNREDGILTAREISNMDLRGCMLTTLSACETGLGEIKGSEGVFGLQRAFKMSGVQNLIVSLWKVPDRETSEFMETFYTNWLTNKLPLREAFRQTQQVMSKKYKPYQWAAFVLVE